MPELGAGHEKPHLCGVPRGDRRRMRRSAEGRVQSRRRGWATRCRLAQRELLPGPTVPDRRRERAARQPRLEALAIRSQPGRLDRRDDPHQRCALPVGAECCRSMRRRERREADEREADRGRPPRPRRVDLEVDKLPTCTVQPTLAPACRATDGVAAAGGVTTGFGASSGWRAASGSRRAARGSSRRWARRCGSCQG